MMRPKIRLARSGESTIAWFGASVVFAIAEWAALFTGWKGYQHHHHLFIAIEFPLLALMPWLAARTALKRYKNMTDPPVELELQQDIGYRLGVLVMTAYALFVIGVAFTLIDH